MEPMPKGASTPSPVPALRAFARQLGWTHLRRYQHVFADESPARKIVWYLAGQSSGGRSDVFLQINEHPIGAKRTYAAAVYAPRYRLYTNWHTFRLGADLHCNPAETVRLEDLLHRRWYETPAARKEFRICHPECAGFSWKRIRETPSLPR